MPTEDELFDQDFREAVAWTEREIAADAFPGGLDPEDRESNQIMLEDLSRLEGIDGRPMSDEEGLASMLDDGVSRPIESAEIAKRDAYIAQLESERQQWQAANKQWQEAYNDQFGESDRQKALTQMKEHVYQSYGVVFADEAKEAQFFNDIGLAQLQTASLQQQAHARHMNDVNESLQRAIEEDPSLAETYHDLISADTGSLRMKGLANDIMNAGPRAGEVLASVANDPSIRALRRPDAAPFLPQSYRRPGPSRAAQARGPEWGRDDVYRSDLAQEDHIYNSVWDD